MKLAIKKRKGNMPESVASLGGEILNLQNRMGRLFDDSFFKPVNSFFEDYGWFSSSFASDWWPKIDVSESDKEIVLKANVPGVDPAQIKIETDENNLILSGKTEEEKEEKGKDWYRTERERGEFRRVFSLPSSVNREGIKASTKHGTIKIVLPKKEESHKKEIAIDTKD